MDEITIVVPKTNGDSREVELVQYYGSPSPPSFHSAVAVDTKRPVRSIRSGALQPEEPDERATGRKTAGSPSALIGVVDGAALLVAALAASPRSAALWVFVAASFVILRLSEVTSRARISLSALEDAPRIVRRLALSFFVVALLAAYGSVDSGIFLQAIWAIVAVLGGRSLVYMLIRSGRRRGWLTERAIIVGSGEIGFELARLLEEDRSHGLENVGFLDRTNEEEAALLLGDISDLSSAVREHQVRHVIVAFGPGRDAELVGTLRAAALEDVDVYVVPRLFELGFTYSLAEATDNIGGIPLVRLPLAARRSPTWPVKRGVDILLASVLSIVAAPLIAVIALAVPLGSPGPVLFRQRRIGQDGREVVVLKFRTLHVNTDSDTTWSVEGDDRQTAVGRWLRRTSLDEIPQLWNILRGEMSMVGPRPERPVFVEEFSRSVRGYGDRHRVPAGLTGWAQVHGLRGDTSISERARFDNGYIDGWSLSRDFIIMVRTGMTIIRDAVAATSPPGASE